MDGRGKRLGNGDFNLLSASTVPLATLALGIFNKTLGFRDSLVASRALLAVDAGESGNDDVDNDGGGVAAGRLSASSLRLGLGLLLLRRAGHDAHYFCVAHFEVGRSVGGILGADLGVEAAEFVPAAAVDAQEGEGVCGCVKGHGGLARGCVCRE